MRIGLIFIAIVLIILGWGAHKEKVQKQQINTILNNQQDVNQIVVMNHQTNKEKELNKSEAAQYKEENPLSHIEKLDSGDRKLFADKADYSITYRIDSKKLYSVEILRLKGKDAAISDELRPFLFEVNGKNYMIYWPEQNKVLEQSENTQKLLNNLIKL